MALTFQKESFTECMPELAEIFIVHWNEIALDKNVIPLDPDWKRYATMDRDGSLHMMTVRDEGILVGYYVAIVMSHLHYKTSMTAWSDIFYLLKEYRGSGWGLTSTGYKLFRHTERMLKELGVQKSYVMTKAHLPLNMLMKRLKYRMIEKTYTKLL